MEINLNYEPAENTKATITPSAWVGVMGLQVQKDGSVSCRTLNDINEDAQVSPIADWYTTRAQCIQYMKPLLNILARTDQTLGLSLPPEEGQCFYCIRATDPSLLVP